MVATVKSEGYWQGAIFPVLSTTMKEEVDNPWSLEQAPPSMGSYSPLSETYFTQPEEDIISMSSLDSTSFNPSGITSEEDEQFFSEFSSNSIGPHVNLDSPASSSSSSNAQQNILLKSVMKSKLQELSSELLSDDDVDDMICKDEDQVQQEQQQMPPPPPPPGFVPTPAKGSFGTIRDFNFQQHVDFNLQQPISPTFASWGAYASSDSARGWQYIRPAPAAQPAVPVVYRGNEDPQVQLVHLLVLCAQAVAQGNERAAQGMLMRLRNLTSPSGTPMERLASYFAEALAARIERRTASALFKGLLSDKLLESDENTQASMLEAFSTFYDYLPIGKFDHLTMNQVILDTVERERAIHILDLQLWFGTQWPALLQALATRPGGPPKVRITAVGTSGHDLHATGVKLMDCARALRVHLEYKQLLLTNLAEQFHSSMVEVHPGEAFIVNSLSQFHYLLRPANSDPTSAEDRFGNFISHIRALRPKVLVMAENDASHNNPDFLNRFGECLKYYSAVFDAMATCASSPTGRLKMERLFAAPKIRNIIACEGPERVERHESMANWSKRLELAGFRAMHLSARAINQAKLLLRLYYTNGYTLDNARGVLVLGWRTLPLNTVSAWRVA